MGAKSDPEIAQTASNTAELSSQYDNDVKKPIVEDNAHFTAAELAKYGQTHRGLSPRHVQLMAIGGKHHDIRIPKRKECQFRGRY